MVYIHFYCYFHNVSADMSSDLLQVIVELGNLHSVANIWILALMYKLTPYFVEFFSAAIYG